MHSLSVLHRVPLTSPDDSDPSDLEEETLDESGLHRQHRDAQRALGSPDSEADLEQAEERRRQRRREDHEQGRPSGEPAEESQDTDEEGKCCVI